MFNIRRGSYANIASTAALVVALGGTSYAATMITSHQIQDGTVRNRDIRTNTIDGTRVRDGGLDVSDLAPDAQSAAYAVYHDEDVTVPSASVGTMLSLTIPRAGAYGVAAKLEGTYYGSTSSWISCGLSAGSDTDYSGASLAANSTETLPLQIVHTFAAGDTVQVRCDAGSADVDAKNIKITAVSVDTLTNHHD